MGTVAVSKYRPLSQLPHIRARAAIVTVVMSNSYATGGDTFPIGATEMQRIMLMAPLSRTEAVVKWKGLNVLANNAGFAAVAAGTPTAPKIQAFVGGTTQTEVGAATNLSTRTFDMLIIGR